MLKNATATELADMLDSTQHHPHLTGSLSMLDEATLAFRSKSAEIAEAQQAFASARLAHMRSYSTAIGGYSDDAWQNAMAAAQRLAAALRTLGDMRIARCEEPAGWGACNSPLNDEGQCNHAARHIADADR